MVSVRQSHRKSLPSFQHWLDALNLPEKKAQALTHCWQLTSPLFEKDEFEQADKALLTAREMVEILAELNLDKDSLVAAMVCPLVHFKQLSLEQVATDYGETVAKLVSGVEQMAAIKTLQSSSKKSQVDNQQIENLRKMLLSMVDDIRAVVIKLAERVCYLRLIKNADEDIKVVAAKETSLIYAPLANRLGIGQLKWELEDISFRYLHPETYMQIARLLDEKRRDRERYMEDFVQSLQQRINEAGIKGHVYGRPKHIYSIWKKMQKKSLAFDQLFDVRAVRIIVDQLQDCYAALGVVHTTWKHLPSEFDDYIATPKPNGYQSIHTVVLGPEGKAVEIQIRTEQMHQDAELGVAAHWRYKEGSTQKQSNSFDDKIKWLRQLLLWQEDVAENGELVEQLKNEVFDDRIYVYTPKGEVVDLPAGSTPLDFAYYIHSNVGHCCIGAKVSGRIVPFTYQLQTGDQVEILTSKKPNPSRDWLNPQLGYLNSARARAKVQHFFRLQDRDKHLEHGQEQLDEAIKALNVNTSSIDWSNILAKFNVKSLDELYINIGNGNTKLQAVVNAIKQQITATHPLPELSAEDVIKTATSSHHKADANGIIVSGVGNLLTHIAKCCHPLPGDDIVGFITQGRGISVHRQDCEQFLHLEKEQPERTIEVQWGEDKQERFEAIIRVVCHDRQGLVRDISTIVTNERVSIYGMESRSDVKAQTVTMTLTIEVPNQTVLAKLMNKIALINDVIEVTRI
jgi:GTP pyrophosphokinase